MALVIQQHHAQGLHRPGTGVVGGTAADRQDHPAGARIEGSANQLASAIGAAGTGVALLRRHPLQATGLGHFDDRGAALGQPAPARLDGDTQRTADPGAAPLTVTGRQHRLHRPLPAVGHRAFDQLRIRPDFGQPLGDGIGDALGAEAVLERVGGDDYFHIILRFRCTACCQLTAAVTPVRCTKGTGHYCSNSQIPVWPRDSG
ncbi:hypothetical protein D3C78_1204140 [compost metagenome]